MVGPDPSHGVSRVVHHKDFYIRGGDMTVLVENHLYRIHSYFFERESLFFRQKVNNSNNNGDQELGSTDSNAYTLEDVKSEDFARFLWVFYNPKYSIYEAPLETWLSILRLANRWSFDSVKELSVRELEKIEIEAVEKISIYHENNISRLYLIPSYVDVCKRDKSLSFTEGMKLGMETVLRIAEAREKLRLKYSESGIRSPTCDDFEDEEVETLIREIFSLGARPTSPISATSPSHGVNGTQIDPFKLKPAPTGNLPKTNGATASRPNAATQATALQATAPQATASQATVPQDPLPPAPPAKTTTQATSTPPAPAPTSAVGKAEGEGEDTRSSSLLSGGVGGLFPKGWRL
ncbi:hypothetical protein HD554DRAFT_678570 [Boletus coccyginus]|nr:hypothetical protein HD554DRAFT_678570 [Boletus coccyginus]